MNEQNYYPLSDDGNRPVTVNEMCLALGMLLYQLRPSPDGDIMYGVLACAKAMKYPIDTQQCGAEED